MNTIIANSFTQGVNAQPQFVSPVPEKKKDSTLSVIAIACCVLGYVFAVPMVGIVGLFTAIIDLAVDKNKEYRHLGSFFGLGLVGLVIILALVSVGKTDKNKNDNIITKETKEINTDTFNDKVNLSTIAVDSLVNEGAGPENASLEERNAVKQAENYLDFSAFSRKGIMDQLTSEYGSHYSTSSAEFAIKYLEDNNLVDWKAQAVRQARNYLDLSPFSRAGLIEQLSSEYGSQFTREEAEYATKYLEENGLVDWKEQAVLQAKSYLELFSFSKEDLIEHLSSEYGSQFTREEAEYAVQKIGY